MQRDLLVSCGLVMNKDEIQLKKGRGKEQKSCGLVMNKDDIQQHCLYPN